MTQIQIKDKLIERIRKIDNQDFLEDLLKILDIEAETNIFLNLSETEKEAILEGEKDFLNGDFLSEEDADKQTREWLGK